MYGGPYSMDLSSSVQMTLGHFAIKHLIEINAKYVVVFVNF